MRAVRFHQHGGPEALSLDTVPDPIPEPNEVLVRIRAAALNGFDPMMLEGSTGLQTPLPMIPCGDLAGEVVGHGTGLDTGDWPVGTPVSIYPILPEKGMMGETTPGGLCELVTVPASALIAMPSGVSFEAAAALPVAYGTAYRMVMERGQIKSGERVLILGATGGVGVGSIQLAKKLGAHVIACGRGAERCARLLEIGADETIDTDHENIRSAIYDRYGKPPYVGESDAGVDVVINYIGGDTYADSLKVMKRHGRMLICGATAGWDAANDLRYLWSYEHSVVGSNGWSKEDQAALLRLVSENELDPVIHAVRPMAEAAASYNDLINRKAVGKLVLTP